MAEIRIHPRFYACPRYVQVDVYRIKTEGVSVATSFSPL